MRNILFQISEIAKNEGISISSLEREIGASKGVLSRAIANNTDIQAKWIQKIVENYPKYSIEWIITGHGDMLKSNEIQIKPVDNDWILRRFEEVVGENALLKKENEELKLSRGKPTNVTTYPKLSKEIGSHIAAEPKK